MKQPYQMAGYEEEDDDAVVISATTLWYLWVCAKRYTFTPEFRALSDETQGSFQECIELTDGALLDNVRK